MILPFRLGVIATAIRVEQGDPYFSRVALLLHFEGANASTTIADASFPPKTLTASGNAQLSTASPLNGTSSLLLDGSGDYVLGTSSAFALGTATATIEVTVSPTALSSTFHVILDTRPIGGNAGFLVWMNSSGQIRAYAQGNSTNSDASSDVYTAAGVAVVGGVYRIAVVIGMTQMRLYVNGVSSGTMQVARTQTNLTGSTLNIGQTREGGNNFAGRVDEVRITKGVARYAADYSPSQAAYADSGTTDHSYAATVLLMTGDGGASDTSYRARTMTAAGNATVSSSVSRYGSGALAFDGAGDWFETTSNIADFRFGTGDFTAEAWINYSSGARVILDAFTTASANSWQLWCTSAGALEWYSSNPSGVAVATSTGVDLRSGTWRHVAACRSGSTLRLFVDGVIVASVTDSRDYNNTTVTTVAVGAQVFLRNSAYDFLGYMDDVRITKGVARYTTAFTPPGAAKTALLPALLLHFDGTTGSTTFTDSSVYGPRSATAAGNAQLSTAQFAVDSSASLLLDGTGDWVQVTTAAGPIPAELLLAGKDFTLEAYVYRTSAVAGVLYSSRNDGVGTQGLNVQFTAGGAVRVIMNGVTVGDTTLTIPTGAWRHVAVSLQGTTVRVFVNGALFNTFTDAPTLVDPSSGYGVRVGASNDGGGNFAGYIDELRLFVGTAVYTAAFNQPTVPHLSSGV